MNILPPGSSISHYRIKEMIARGGMGEVYKAVDRRLNRVVAIKIPSSTSAGNEKAQRRLLREAHAASRLSHPSICTIYEVGEEQGRTFIVMEYIEGLTLKEVLERTAGRAGLPVLTAVRYALQLADALEEAHRQKVLHRDLKPSNIIINQRGTPVILDFGLAKHLREPGQSDDDLPTAMQSLTTESTIVGTVAYMSPEQIRSKPLDARSDIFSFGSLFYEILTGRRPFTGTGQVEVMHAILHQSPVPVTRLRPDVDPSLEAIIARAHEKDPRQRYATITELKLELWRVVKEQGYEITGAITTATNLRTRSSSQILEQTGAWLRHFFSPRRAPLYVALALLAASLGWTLRPSRRGVDPVELGRLRAEAVQSWKSDLGSLIASRGKFSPDGRYLVYASTRAGDTVLWLKQLKGGEPIVVRGTDDQWIDDSPIWSPDGDRIAFISNRNQGLGIWAVPTLGGTPQPILTLDRGSHTLVHWSRDGKKIYFDRNGELHLFEVGKHETTRLISFGSAPAVPRNFRISSQEDRIAYVDLQDGQHDIFVRPLGGGAPVRVTKDSSSDWNPVWTPDGKRIVYNTLRNGIAQVCLIDLGGGDPVQLTFNDLDSEVTDVSADGTRIAYSSSRDECDLWSIRVTGGGETPLTAMVGVELWPDASRDGRVVFQATKLQSVGPEVFDGAIYSRLPGDGRQLQLAERGFNPQWSPDGTRVAFLRREYAQTSLWLVSESGGQAEQLVPPGVMFGGLSHIPYNRQQPKDYAWSPDGRRIAYCAMHNGRAEASLINLDGTGETRLTAGGEAGAIYFSPLFSPDGARIALLALGADRKLWKALVWEQGREKGELREVYRSERTMRLLGWTEGGRELLVKESEGVSLQNTPSAIIISRLNLAGGAAQLLARIDAVYLNNIQLSPDGRSLAYVSREMGTDQLEVRPVAGSASRALVRTGDPLQFFAGLAWAPDNQTIYFARQSNTRSISIIDQFR